MDVDSHVGMRQGTPVLLSLFRKYNINASFFVPMGKDDTGWTVKRVFTRKGFLKNQGRIGILDTWGLKTLMYGILLPGPEIAGKNKDLLRVIVQEGHEAGIHGLDHVYWHDHIKHLNKEKTESILGKAIDTYRAVLGTAPLSFAAPGWMINRHALAFFESHGFAYTSDTRGRQPFFPVMEGTRFKVLQVPTTLPTLDEVVGVVGTDPASLAEYYFNLLEEGVNILTIHTQLEGNKWTGFLDALIQRTLSEGYTFRRLIDIAIHSKDKAETPFCGISYGHMEGRAGEVTLQGAISE
ncbi:MAG: 4-deoxy-4-formamido-L-arabinose-phosphoundecaprenol deformylase [Syntrophus sp. (in: bacteria)]|nr:4-deoxy-4-formamido-L-arabinose-phosphoundecaprenol deformylase [Syntrophus sp. (in: bacteria)]